jgi:hypothetical protein
MQQSTVVIVIIVLLYMPIVVTSMVCWRCAAWPRLDIYSPGLSPVLSPWLKTKAAPREGGDNHEDNQGRNNQGRIPYYKRFFFAKVVY